MPASTIRVLVYDSSNLQCELLSTGLESLQRGLEVECVNNLEATLTLLSMEMPTVVIISDAALSGATVSFMKQVHTRFPAVPLVSLLPEGRGDLVVEAFRAGARGIVYSNQNLARLASCIWHVSRGKVWVRYDELGMIFEGLSNPMRTANASVRGLLSPREQEISRLVAEGMSNREISQALRITEGTVKNSLFHVFDKLGISNRVELVRYLNRPSE